MAAKLTYPTVSKRGTGDGKGRVSSTNILVLPPVAIATVVTRMPTNINSLLAAYYT